jgi:lysine decarboxylase/arginine decarboxylase
MKINYKEWPVLLLSDEIHNNNDVGHRIREFIKKLNDEYDCSVIPSVNIKDAKDIVLSRADIGTVIVDFDISDSESHVVELLTFVRNRNKNIPILLMTDTTQTESIPTEVLEVIDGYIWELADTIDFLAGRIIRCIDKYIEKVQPPFFATLAKYVKEYKYAWHTPGHMGGDGFLKSPAGVNMFNFYGETVFRGDLSISVPELGSLLDHEGVVGDAEKYSAKVFNADHTFYVLNGTSNVNQIIWRSQLVDNQLAFVDRNCHKSLNYAMINTRAYPIYMIPRRNGLGIIGPVKLNEFEASFIKQQIENNKIIPAELKSQKVKMSALTNSTYDGVIYNVKTIKSILKHNVENLHFDEAWYAYAKFHPIYKNHFGMNNDETEAHPPIFVSQSTHKLLAAFSQASMLHIKNGSSRKIDHEIFNETYMMYGSTSPQYNMIASLEVATKMMDDNGDVILNDNILDAIQLRKKVASIQKEYSQKNNWFFGMWQPVKAKYNGGLTDFISIPDDYLASNQDAWVMSDDNNWHGFKDIEDDYVMLDPIKLTFTTPGISADGVMQESGIPASVVSNFLIDRGIVVEKTDYYSFLMLHPIGTTRGKHGELLAALFKFKELYDKNVLLGEVFPEMVKKYPSKYENKGLKDHCNDIHKYFKDNDLISKMQAAFENIPDQKMKPSDAYKCVVENKIERVEISKETIMGRTVAIMLVPYPPGIPIMMGGELMNEKSVHILDFLKTRQDFENEIPGYTSDIHGVERIEKDGKLVFTTLCIKE